MSNHWDGIITTAELHYLSECGLVPSTVLEVEVGELRVQHRSEWCFDHFLKADAQYGTRSILGSPFYEAACLIRDNGKKWILNNYTATSYFELFRHFGEIGWARDWRTGRHVKVKYSKATIKEKVIKLIRTYESISLHGYLKGGHEERRLMALRQPYEKIRFDMVHDTLPYEIWSGHHRAACLAALRVEKVSIVLAIGTDLAKAEAR
tara:strand:- start:145 stop:765 length:621 start_codon:yes stop_codon:yes gene_type:complete